MYAINPKGIEVTGEPSIKLRLPELNGSLNYLPENGTRVVMLGVGKQHLTIMPVGVGRIEDGYVYSEKLSGFELLDQIGFSFVIDDHQVVLSDYVEESISLRELSQQLSN